MVKRKCKKDSRYYVGFFYLSLGLLEGLMALLGMLKLFVLTLFFAMLLVVIVNGAFAWRTKNGYFAVTAIHYMMVAGLVWSKASGHHGLYKAFIVAFCFTLTCLLWVGRLRKLKWRREEILELAARPVEDSLDGFTSRPYPSGKAQYSPAEIAGFSRFLLRHLMAVPYVEAERVVYAITGRPIEHMLGIRRRYDRDSWVAFDGQGNVTVSICKNDYMHYQDEYTFDRLCQSLAALFIEFLDLYRQGKGSVVVRKLNELRFNPFTGALIGF
jgi:hypothetical protein